MTKSVTYSVLLSLFLFSPIGLADSVDSQAEMLSEQASNLNPQVIELGLKAYDKAHAQGLDPQGLLTIVDYSKPSTEPRFWVLNLKNDTVLYQTLVAHGSGSGDDDATRFSDDPSSHESSLGLYLTDQTYTGHHGCSLKLQGLDKGFNDMAAAREIVVHAANYVSQSFAETHGRLGRSWGCFALDPSVAPKVISAIKGGTLIFAYYPDKNFLTHSEYLA